MPNLTTGSHKEKKQTYLLYATGLANPYKQSIYRNYQKQKYNIDNTIPFFNLSSQQIADNIYSLAYYPAVKEVFRYFIAITNQIKQYAPNNTPTKRGQLIICPRVCRLQIAKQTGRTINTVKYAIKNLKAFGLLMSFQSRRHCNIYYIDKSIIDIYKKTFNSKNYPVKYRETQKPIEEPSYNAPQNTYPVILHKSQEKLTNRRPQRKSSSNKAAYNNYNIYNIYNNDNRYIYINNINTKKSSKHLKNAVVGLQTNQKQNKLETKKDYYQNFLNTYKIPNVNVKRLLELEDLTTPKSQELLQNFLEKHRLPGITLNYVRKQTIDYSIEKILLAITYGAYAHKVKGNRIECHRAFIRHILNEFEYWNFNDHINYLKQQENKLNRASELKEKAARRKEEEDRRQEENLELEKKAEGIYETLSADELFVYENLIWHQLSELDPELVRRNMKDFVLALMIQEIQRKQQKC